MQNKLSHPLAIIVIFLLGFFGVNFLKVALIDASAAQGYDSIDYKHGVTILFNVAYTLVSYGLIRKYQLFDLAGWSSNFKFKNWYLILFPLYLVLINIPDPGDINFDHITLLNYSLLVLWGLSVGFSEEFMLRGFMQSLLLTKYGKTKKGIVFTVVGTAILFGLLHLLKFDKGLYGEIAQVLFASFIGTMFGAILLRTQKLWPLILVHALIDIMASLDKLEVVKVLPENSEPTYTLMNSLILVIVVFPCFIYGLILLRKVKVEELQVKIR
jgi:hypothetical protein